MKTYELPPNAGRVISSLRDAGYEFNTAVSDIVDNSIAAHASTVYIAATCNPVDGQIEVSIADNGDGMTPKQVLNAMTYGSDEREDEHSLGKFGLGLKTASTSQCRRVSCISRNKADAKHFKLVLDIDYTQQTNRWEYYEEEATGIDRLLFDKAAKNHSGTLVRWEKCDRVMPHKYKQPGGRNQQAAFKKKLERLEFHLSLVFQRFLDTNDNRAPNVEILLNGDKVKPWDPFCRQLKETQLAVKKRIGKSGNPRDAESIIINAYIVPPRDKISLKDEDYVFPKLVSPDALQGIYVYRENRLIHWGDWCGIRKVEFHYRLCRVELSFDSSLDELFSVDFKKSRIQLDANLSDVILTQVLEPARSIALKRYRGSQAKKNEREAEMVHAKANNDIGKSVATTRNFKANKIADGKTKITTNRGATFIEEKPVIQDKSSSGVIPVSSLPDGLLWNPRLVEDAQSFMSTSVEINMSHPFYEKAYSLCQGNPNAIKALDYLLWSLANAEYSAKDQDSAENFEDLRREVSRNLRELSKKLPDKA